MFLHALTNLTYNPPRRCINSMANNEGKPSLDEYIVQHRKYKDDTNHVAGWLAETALRCGFELESPMPGSNRGPPKPKKKKKKGKGNKVQRGTKQATGQATMLPNTLQVSQFVPMAQAIAAHTPRMEFPRALHRVLRRAIGARRRFNEWHRMVAPVQTDSNDRHAHFILVLTSTLELLSPLLEPVKSDKTVMRTTASSVEDVEDEDSLPLANRFSELQVDHLEDVAEDSQAGLEETEYTKLPSVPKVSIEQDDSEIEDDFFLAIHVFVNELVDVRRYISTQWQRYQEDAIGLETVSLLTNTALMMVRRTEMGLQDLQRPEKYPADIYPVWTFLPMLMFRQCGILDNPRIECDKLATSNWRSLMTVPPELSDGLEQRCLWDAFKVVKYAVHNSQPPPGRHGFTIGAANIDYKKGNGDRKELSGLFAVFLQLQVAAMSSEGTLAEDEVTRGVRFAIESNTVPAWVTLGFQIILDVRKHIEADMLRPLRNLTAYTGLKVDGEWGCIDVDRLYPPVGPRPPHIPDLHRFMGEMMEMVALDGFGENARRFLMRYANTSWPRCLSEQNFFLKCNPIRCGLLIYNLCLQSHEKALDIDMGLLVVTPLIHLYKACQLAYPDAPVWPDIEFLLSYQDTNRIFFGGLPKTFKEAAVKYSLSMGGSPTFFATNRRKGAFRMDYNKLRLVESRCLLGNILSGWFSRREANVDKVTLDLFRFLNDPVSFDKLAAQIEMRAEDRKSLERLHPRPHQCICSMADSIIPYVVAEHAILGRFNSLLLVELCNDAGIELVRALPDYADEQVTCTAVLMILWEALEAEELALRLGSDVGEAVRELPGLKKAHEIIQSVIRESGTECGSDETRRPRFEFEDE